ncbi:unnamed protein product [Diatraea saccharalis]|uniref:Uncharacterized protein n=1 Tax=Diatraea saccharalis TaxID=40085 RepID=A0A9N9RFH1_9NEOP|nr:unnamed protein product [Diatraea saccharalis]
MPFPSDMFKIFGGHIHFVLNVSIMIFTFFESYMFPLAVIKWVIVITKYGGLPYLEKYKTSARNLRSHYNYNLHLITIYNSETTNVMQKNVSSVSVTVEKSAIMFEDIWIRVCLFIIKCIS